MNEKYFRELIREVIRKELDEMTTTGAVAGFETPHAFAGKSAKNKKRIKDIAEKLNTVGHLTTLKRTRIGKYNQSSCIAVKDLSKWISART